MGPRVRPFLPLVFWRGRLSISRWFGRVGGKGSGVSLLHSIHQLSVLLKFEEWSSSRLSLGGGQNAGSGLPLPLSMSIPMPFIIENNV